MSKRIAVVTGASSGIGEASARRLAADGFEVICAARRVDRIEALAKEIGGRAMECDVTSPSDIARLAEVAGDRVDLIFANAGAAIGVDPVATANLQDWRTMYEVNVLGAVATIQALLPAAINARGTIIAMSSYAAAVPYEGGGGYCGVKAAVRSMMGSLRLELFDQPVRICQIEPGLVATPEFTLNRLGGDQEKADATYRGVKGGALTAEDIAEIVGFVAGQPEHINLDSIQVRPRAQASKDKVDRE